jgi:hypothetical protein
MSTRRLHGYVPVRLLDGTWRYVHALVNPKPRFTDKRGQRQYQVQFDYMPGMSRYKGRTRRFWESSILSTMPPEGGDSDTYTWYRPDPDGATGPHLIRATETASESGLWWRSPRGALERPATVYEYMHRHENPPPREDWTLVDGSSQSGLLKMEPAVPSELDDEDRHEKISALQHRADVARTTIARHARVLALKRTLIKKWEKKLARIEKRIAEERGDKS